jgi:hypothetical protein
MSETKFGVLVVDSATSNFRSDYLGRGVIRIISGTFDPSTALSKIPSEPATAGLRVPNRGCNYEPSDVGCGWVGCVHG